MFTCSMNIRVERLSRYFVYTNTNCHQPTENFENDGSAEVTGAVKIRTILIM